MSDTRSTTSPTSKVTLHRDGSVTLWQVYQQQWVRTARPSDETLASLGWETRDRVLRHLARAQEVRS